MILSHIIVSSKKTHLESIKPLESKRFRIQKIIGILTEHFKNCWEHQKSTSSKLSFYHSIKSTFGRESYLDCCKGFSRRYCTTQLRISAHDLQIERGRYSNLSREERICNWCKTSMNQNKIEDEMHVLFECDLYSKLRTKLITNLNRTPPLNHGVSTHDIHTQNITLSASNLKSNLMSILSPYCINSNPNSPIIHPSQIPEIKSNSPSFTTLLERRAYAINCVCTYILKCSEERKKLTDSMREMRNNRNACNKVTINF